MKTIVKEFMCGKTEIGKYGSKFCIVFYLNDEQKCFFAQTKSELKQLFRELKKHTKNIEINPPEYWIKELEEYRDCGSHNTNSMIHFSEWFENFQYQLNQ
tara:strand:- start:1033 stop:1332 length:300 start_codon:yes stop_codon:yes gene_type:complete